MARFEAVVFDFDGLIADTERVEHESWQAAWAHHGVALPLDLWVTCIGTVDVFDPQVELERRLGRPVDGEELAAVRRARRDELLAELDVLPGVRDRLDEAHVLGWRTAIASSSSIAWVSRHLDTFGLADLFMALSCYDGSVPAKPSPDLYLGALATLGVAPSLALAFEDSPHGIAAAKAAGMVCVAVPHGLTRDLDMSAADLVIDSLESCTLTELARTFS